METTRKIGDNLFSVSPLGFEDSMDIEPLLAPALADFMRLYALFVEQATKLAEEGGQILSLDTAEIVPRIRPALSEAADIVASLSAKLGPNLKTVRRTLLKGATMDGKQLYAMAQGQSDLINVMMRGRNLDGWKLMMFALEVSYPDFFEMLRPLAIGGKAAPSPESTKETASDGGAGASS